MTLEINTKCPKRVQEGFKLFKNRRVKEISNGRFSVHSFSGNYYEVSLIEESLWHCECGDFQENGLQCSEIYATILFLISRGVIR